MDFANGWSYHVEGLLLTGSMIEIVIFIIEIFGRVTNFERGYAKDHFITCDHRVKTMYFKTSGNL